MLLYTEYTLVIDTDSESYDFYKFLCAYCTGFVDETEEARQYSDLYYMESGIEDDESSKGKVADEKNPFYQVIALRGEDLSPCAVWLNKRHGGNEDGEYALLTEDNAEEFSVSPAPFSVGIFFDEEPTQQQIQIIKDRASKFFDKVYLGVKIEGFRLIIHTKYGEEKDI